MESVLLVIAVGAIVLFITFGPIVHRADNRFVIDPDALANPTGRLRFRHPTFDDLAVLDALYSDPEAVEANFWDADAVATTRAMLHDPARFEPWARMSLVATLATNDPSADAGSTGTHDIADGETSAGDIVGLATLSAEDGSDRRGVSIGLQMVPEHRGKGLATEVLAAMISSAKGLTDGDIWISTSIANHAVQHMMQRLGYQPEPAASPQRAPDGTLVETRWYRVGAAAPLPRFP